MQQVIGVFDGGFEKLFFNGQMINAGVIVFRTAQNESEPIDHVGYCAPHIRDSIIKYLKKIQWQPKRPAVLHPELLSELNIYMYPADQAHGETA
jgi:hypothetical protein